MKKITEIVHRYYPYLFAFFYFILLMFVETSTLYAFQNKSFLTTKEYLAPFLKYGGGLMDYVGLFFSEILKFNFTGALLYALITLASILLYKNLLAKTGVTKNLLLISLYPFIFLALLTFNYFHPLSMNLKLLLCLLIIHIIIYGSTRGITFQIMSTLFLVALWYLCGLEFFVIAFGYIIIHTAIKKVLVKNIPFFISSVTLVFLLNTFVYYTPLAETFLKINEFGSRMPRLLLITYVLFMVMPITAIIKLNISINDILQFLLILGIGYLVGVKAFNKVNHAIGKFLIAGNKNEYTRILELRSNTDINTRIISAYTNFALMNKRILLDQMFNYDQGAGRDGFFPAREFDSFNAFSNMKLCFDMGLSNQSIRWAMEATTYFGFNAEILKHLVLSHLINDNIKTAEKYFLMFEHTLFNRKQKKQIGDILKDYKKGDIDKLILEKKRLRPPQDFYSGNRNDKESFAWAAEASNNPKAFEWYIGLCLLENDYEAVRNAIPRFRILGYKRLPVHVQEALCLFYAEGQKKPDLFGYEIDPNILKHCTWFFQTINNYNDNLRMAQNELMQRSPNTYWYYLYYISPVTKMKTE